MSDLTRLSLTEARDGLAAGTFTASELTEAFLGAIEAGNRHLNAYITTTADAARQAAKAADERYRKGEARALEGLPLGIKDLFATKGVHTQAASHVLDAFLPPYESTVTQNLWERHLKLLFID